MKKVVSIILAVLMVISLAACGTSQSSAPPNSSQAPASTPPASKPPASTPPASTPSASVQPSQNLPPVVTGIGEGKVGYITDDVDHNARETYDIVYTYSSPSNLTRYMLDCMNALSKRLNIKMTDSTANGDANVYINNFSAILLNEPDGLIVDMVFEYQTRIKEILDESGVPYIALFNSVVDQNGSELVPVVMMNHTLNGEKQVQLMADSYKAYWGDIKQSEIALLVMTYSLNLDLIKREKGAVAKFKELFPGNQVFTADAVTAGQMNAQSAYDLSSGIISGNPNIKYWFVASVVEDMSIGVARATESLGKTDSVLITGSGSSVLPGEWDAGYKGNWIGNFAVSNYQYAVPALCGVIALRDGRAKPETLWQELKRPNDVCAQFVVGTDVITRDNYKNFFKEIEMSFGINKS